MKDVYKRQGIHNYEYLSPGFMDMIRFAADEAAKRDMQFDLTLGSSWPFGGPFLKEELDVYKRQAFWCGL